MEDPSREALDGEFGGACLDVLMWLSLVGAGARRDASISRRVELGVGLMEMEMRMMEASLLCFDRMVGSKVFGGGWVDDGCVCGCVCLPLFLFVWFWVVSRSLVRCV